ncbi:MAG: beta-N-acetylhexosaminidase [Aliishimia sp.]
MSRFGACMLSSDGPRLSADEKALFRDTQPFGFIIFARHVQSPDQLRTLCNEFREAVGRECLITVDQEGGRVQRLRAPHWREWHPALEHAVGSGKNAARSMYLRARLIAHELHSVGIDSNCAPNLDIAGQKTHPFLLNRCYGTDIGEVVDLGRAVASGLLEGGVVPIMKHIPGHGRGAQDSHKALPVVHASKAELIETDFFPFQALKDLPMGMTAHLVFSDMDASPVTQSSTMMRVIRETIGFDGLLMTDDISMQALSGSLGERTEASIKAGCDVVLHCNDDFAARVCVAEAAGEMTEAAQTRADAAMAWRKKPDEIDIPAVEAELEALLGGPVYV